MFTWLVYFTAFLTHDGDKSEAVSELLKEAACQLSLDSLRDHKSAPYPLNFSTVRCICHEVFASQPSVSGKLMTYQLLLLVNRRYYLQYNDYRKVLFQLYINICPIQNTRLTFWKVENRQAIDSYDDSECNSRMLEEGSYRFSFGSRKAYSVY